MNRLKRIKKEVGKYIPRLIEKAWQGSCFRILGCCKKKYPS